MAPETCAQHPQTAAAYRCDGCQRRLCEECVEAGHALIFCKICGERAVGLAGGEPVRPQQRQREELLARPYSLKEAMLYPFRGLGLYLFISGSIAFGLAQFLASFTCLGLIFFFIILTLMIGLQFKIVRSTADGDNELPDWPEYFALSERIFDLLTYVFLAFLQFAPVVLWTLLFGLSMEVWKKPDLLFWGGFAACFWLGTALFVIAYGAAGTYDRMDCIRVDLHLRTLGAAGADAVTVVNLVFVLQALVLIVQTALSETVPILGGILSGLLGIYWFFTGPHLAGVLFRRHRRALDDLYRY